MAGESPTPETVTHSSVKELESRLSVSLPEDFALFLHQAWDIHQIGCYVFSNQGESYAVQILRNNAPFGIPDNHLLLNWWGIGHRPENWLLVAGTDGWAILLDCVSGSVWAYRRSEAFEQREQVASSFLLFVQGAGTCVYAGVDTFDEHFYQEVGHAAGAAADGSFWLFP